MTALALLQQLHEHGLALTPSPDGTVRCRAPKGVLTPALLDAMRQHKSELHALVEDWSERAAIMEYEGGLTREDAEWQACLCVQGEGVAHVKGWADAAPALLLAWDTRRRNGWLAHEERCSTMAWEQRGTQTYYYRSVRRNGGVTKEYLGTGPLTALCCRGGSPARPAPSRGRDLAPGTSGTRGAGQALDAWWDRARCCSRRHSIQKGITSMTEAHGVSAPTRDEVKILLRKAEKGDTTVLPTLRTWMDKTPGHWETVGDLAKAAREALIETSSGENLVVREAITRKCATLTQELTGPQPFPP